MILDQGILIALAQLIVFEKQMKNLAGNRSDIFYRVRLSCRPKLFKGVVEDFLLDICSSSENNEPNWLWYLAGIFSGIRPFISGENHLDLCP